MPRRLHIKALGHEISGAVLKNGKGERMGLNQSIQILAAAIWPRIVFKSGCSNIKVFWCWEIIGDFYGQIQINKKKK